MHFSCGIVRPPYEAGSCFLQVTSGCSHNKCRFCTFYKEAPFSVSPESEIKEDLQEIRDAGVPSLLGLWLVLKRHANHLIAVLPATAMKDDT